jgi:hypothetical protein
LQYGDSGRTKPIVSARTNETLKIRRKEKVILTNRGTIEVLEVNALADVIITNK